MKIKETLSIKDEKEVYTKAIITSIETKVSKKGIQIYFIEITNELEKMTIYLFPEYFEQEMKLYPNKPVQYSEFKQRYKVNDNLELINFINKPSIMKIKRIFPPTTKQIPLYIGLTSHWV